MLGPRRRADARRASADSGRPRGPGDGGIRTDLFPSVQHTRKMRELAESNLSCSFLGGYKYTSHFKEKNI